MANKKIVTSGIAVALAGVVLFGGTFAWQSVSQKALNEISAVINPGGRLHDDFNNTTTADSKTMEFDKDVYVENFTTLAENGVDIFVRVRLDEYMELGKGAGVLNEDGTASDENKAVSLVEGSRIDDKSTWKPYIFGETLNENPIRKYWELDVDGGETTMYMPTFNKNKDSLEADINGSSADNFATYVDYNLEENGTKYAWAIYDYDAESDGGKEIDEIKEAGIDVNDVINTGADALVGPGWENHVELRDEEHKAISTVLGEKSITMEEWLERDIGSSGKIGNYWVWDDDGWAYWACPVSPETATSLLLDGLNRTGEVINRDWYYGINVVAQFVTGDDLGADSLTGFYDIEEGSAPSANALKLLEIIGVDTGTKVNNETQLREILANGGTAVLNSDIYVQNTNLIVSKDSTLNLNGHKLTGESIWHQDDAASMEDKSWSIVSVRDGATLRITGDGKIEAAEDDSYCVDVRDGSKVIINDGEFKGNISAVYVHEGEAIINGGKYSIQQDYSIGDEYRFLLNCYNENYAAGKADIKVYGGSFYGNRHLEGYVAPEHYSEWHMAFNPASECEAATASRSGKYLADGYTSELSEVIDADHTDYRITVCSVKKAYAE